MIFNCDDTDYSSENVVKTINASTFATNNHSEYHYNFTFIKVKSTEEANKIIVKYGCTSAIVKFGTEDISVRGASLSPPDKPPGSIPEPEEIFLVAETFRDLGNVIFNVAGIKMARILVRDLSTEEKMRTYALSRIIDEQMNNIFIGSENKDLYSKFVLCQLNMLLKVIPHYPPEKISKLLEEYGALDFFKVRERPGPSVFK